jgi:phosphoribosylformylglycinamidine cyclo-ligase
MAEEDGLSYRAAGVDLAAAERAKEGIEGLVASTRDSNTLSELGLFGGLYRVPDDVPDPVLVSSADGVGTKLKVAFMADRHDTVGQDLVNHCVNDILVQGARPLFFLDYLASGGMDETVVTAVVGGIAQACRENGCALLGGETAQMPEFYSEDEYDLAGFIVGIVSHEQVLDGSRVRAGDVLIGLESSGLHTNGFTLARKIVFDVMKLAIDAPFPDIDRSVGDVLLEVHRSYLSALWPLLEDGRLGGLAHITGGGIVGNLPRILGAGLGAVVDTQSWEVPPVFRVLAEAGAIERSEMMRVFNMGVGLILVTSPEKADGVVAALGDGDTRGWIMGEVETGEGVRLA